MSGSNGDNIKVTITGDATGFSDAADQAAAAAKKLSDIFVMTGDKLMSANRAMNDEGRGVANLAQSLLNAGVSAAEVAKSLGLTLQPTQSLGQAAQTAAAGLTSLSQAARQLDGDEAITTEEARKLDAAVSRLMATMGGGASATQATAAGINGVGSAAGQAAPQIATESAELQRLNAAAAAALASLNGSAAASAGSGQAAGQAATQVEGASAAYTRLQESIRRVMAGLTGFRSDAEQSATAARTLAGDTDAASASAQRGATSQNALGAAVYSTGTRFVGAGQQVNGLAMQLLRSGTSAQETARMLGITTEALRGIVTAAAESGNALKNQDEVLRQLNTDLEQTPARTAHAATGFAGITREIIVIGHEAMTGNFSRIPGSLMVLAERSGGLMAKMGELAASMSNTAKLGVAAFGALAGAVALFTTRAYEAAHALHEVAAAAGFMGVDVKQTTAAYTSMVDKMQQGGITSTKTAREIASGILQLGNTTLTSQQRLADLAAGISAVYGEGEVKSRMGAIQNAFMGGADAVEKYLLQINALTPARIAELAAAKEVNDTQRAQNVLFGALEEHLAPARKAIADYQRDMEALRNTDTGLTPTVVMPSLMPPPRPHDQLPSAEVDPALVRQYQQQQALLEVQNKRLALQQQIQEQEALAAKATNPQARLVAEQAAAEARAKLYGSTSEAEQLAYQKIGRAAVEAGETAAAAARNSGRTQIEATEAQLAAEAAAWKDASTNQQLTVRQRDDALANYRRLSSQEEKTNARENATTLLQTQRATLAQMLAELSAHRMSGQALALAELNTRVAFWKKAVADHQGTAQEILAAKTELYNAERQLNERSTRFGEAAAKKGVLDKISELNAEQAAVRENFGKVMEIEQQKIALLQAAGSNYTAKLNEELARRSDLERQHAAQLIQQAEQTMRQMVQDDNQAIAQRRAELEQDVAEDRISKATMLATLRSFIAEKRALEAQAGANYAASLNDQSKAYQKFVDQLALDQAKANTEQRQLTTQITKDIESQWQTALSPISQAFNSSIDGVIQGTQTLQQAVANMAQSIILSYVKMSIEADTKWAASQLAQLFSTETTEAGKTAATATGAATRGTIAAGEGASQNGGLLVRVARFIAAQLGMTTSEATGTATRTAIVAGGEVAQTAAVAEGAIAQVAAKKTAKAAGSAMSVAAGGASVLNSAYEAAAGTYASVAQIPYVGWILAPGAAAAAFAAVMAFNTMKSFAVGAWNLPSDTVAQLHAGEMVVPANFATGLRGALSGGASGGRGGGSVSMNYAPTINAGGGGSTRDLSRILARSNDKLRDSMLDLGRNGALKLPGR